MKQQDLVWVLRIDIVCLLKIVIPRAGSEDIWMKLAITIVGLKFLLTIPLTGFDVFSS